MSLPNSIEAVASFWGPIEKLLRDQYPQASTPATQQLQLKRDGADAHTLEQISWLRRQRNQVVHEPYRPIRDIELFAQTALHVWEQVTDILQRGSFARHVATHEDCNEEASDQKICCQECGDLVQTSHSFLAGTHLDAEAFTTLCGRCRWPDESS